MGAALKLEVFQNGELLNEVPFDGKDLWVGRDDDCVIRLDDRAISRKHAVLKATVQGIEFEKKSKFGSMKVNGKDADSSVLKSGDRLEMGPFEIRVVQAAVAALKLEEKTVALPEISLEAEVEPAAPLAVDLGQNEANFLEEGIQFGVPEGVETVDPSQTHTSQFDFSKVDEDGATRVFSAEQYAMKPVLQFGDGAANVSQFELTDNEVAIGRSQKCNVVLEDKKSSRKHSLILKRGDQFFVKDLGSANGTLVNGERVDERLLQSGDVITIGDTQFTFCMVQADYEQKKEAFIPVPEPRSPQPEMSAASMAQPFSPMENAPPIDFMNDQPMSHEAPAPDFTAPAAEKKSFIGKFLDSYRAMNTKKQIIYGIAILAFLYLMLDEEPEQKKAKLNTGNAKSKVAQKKNDDKKIGMGASFESLTPEQQRYIDTQYQLSFDLYKNREYDSSLLEIGKIFSLVQDYKNAREIEAFAREGKRKLESQEEERKKREQERLAEAKLQTLIEQASLYMEKGKFKEAESLFPDIEVLQPENTTVSEWRKKIVAENERLEKLEAQKRKIEGINKLAWVDFKKALELVKSKNYWDALDSFDELLTRPIDDQKLSQAIKSETKKVEDEIAAQRDPLLAQGKQLEQENKFAEAYRFYQKAYAVDPVDTQATEGMKRIRGNLNGRAKSIYAEGVFAESYGDMDTAEKQYRQVLDVVPTDDDYYQKAELRLRKLTVLRKPASESAQ